MRGPDTYLSSSKTDGVLSSRVHEINKENKMNFANGSANMAITSRKWMINFKSIFLQKFSMKKI